MLRKLLPVLFLGIFFFQLVGFSVYFNLEKSRVRKELHGFIKQGLPEKQQKKFHLSESEFSRLRWIKVNKEFKIGETYYDVISLKKNKNKQVDLICYDDQLESTLFKNLTHYVNFNLGDQKSTNPLQFIFDNIEEEYLIEHSVKDISLKSVTFNSDDSFFYQDSYYETNLETPSPPPNFA